MIGLTAVGLTKHCSVTLILRKMHRMTANWHWPVQGHLCYGVLNCLICFTPRPDSVNLTGHFETRVPTDPQNDIEHENVKMCYYCWLPNFTTFYTTTLHTSVTKSQISVPFPLWLAILKIYFMLRLSIVSHVKNQCVMIFLNILQIGRECM